MRIKWRDYLKSKKPYNYLQYLNIPKYILLVITLKPRHGKATRVFLPETTLTVNLLLIDDMNAV